MWVRTKAFILDSTAERLKHQYFKNGTWADYPWNPRGKYEKIVALPPGTVEEEYLKILSNRSWTENKCDNCGKDVNATIQLGEKPDYESNTAMVCEECLKRALDEIRLAL